MAVKINEEKEEKTEIEENEINYKKEEDADTDSIESRDSDVSNFKIVILDIFLPLFDVLLDILKGLLLIFQYDTLSSFYKFEAHFFQKVLSHF